MLRCQRDKQGRHMQDVSSHVTKIYATIVRNKINNENTCKPVKYKIKCTRSGTNNDSQISNQHEKFTNQQRKKNNDRALKKKSKNNVIPHDVTTNTKRSTKEVEKRSLSEFVKQIIFPTH